MKKENYYISIFIITVILLSCLDESLSLDATPSFSPIKTRVSVVSNKETADSKSMISKINTPGWEDSPYISPDGKRLYFMYSSLDPKQFIVDKKAVVTGPSRTDVKPGPNDIVKMAWEIDTYVSEKDEYGQWSQPIRLEFNTIYDECCGMVSYDGNEIWFSTIGVPEARYDLDIYVTTRKTDGSWGKGVNIGTPINTKSVPGAQGVHESNPHISKDGNTLYFEADHGYPNTDYFQGQPGFMGNSYDLYYSEKQQDGSWSMPKNLGPNINTMDSEMQVWVGIDGFTGKKVIYFERYKPWGEHYTYVSELVDNQWTKAEKVLFGPDKKPHSGEPSLTEDGKYFYSVKDVGSLDKWQLDIYVAERQLDGSWGTLKPVD